jgi:hypothetical protein
MNNLYSRVKTISLIKFTQMSKLTSDSLLSYAAGFQKLSPFLLGVLHIPTSNYLVMLFFYKTSHVHLN